ncbi:hypothetical protein OFDDKENP_00139 [Aeromonas phage B614]|nr:hypothetical protein OFDDKENP_00139 [Aeromonas phage B614]UYD58133.1 hypothetical protein JNEOFJEA_00036 [Aeromonas phage UP87]UYD58497.1 hypothetical protein IPAKJDPM_00154 [Aeromonas phage avDM14-QBC]UYD58713.1 hypothetical protein HNNIDBEH_00120 [Aeromonas phage avDM10-HWA]UYD58984.1 hypothetical protein OFOPOMKI_00134 [Aeromonas phage avDM7-IJDJ]UYD59796.1 hypothetical protein LEHPIFIF_00023 [Aeromonas phage avDM9-HANS]
MKFVSIIAFGLLSSSAMAASFDCNTPGLKTIEKAICQVPDLSLMDEQLADAYKVVRHIKEVKEDQKAFIVARNKAKSLNELRDLHQNRIAELNIIAELEGIEAKPHSEVVNATRIIKTEKVVRVKSYGNSPVGQLITQFKKGNTAVFNGQNLDATYRRSDGPGWMLMCASKIVDTDVLPKWSSEAAKNGLSAEFESVRWKFDVAMYNATLNNLSKNIGMSKSMCDTVNLGM